MRFASKNLPVRLLLMLFLSVGLLSMPGCGGCQKDKTAKSEQEKKDEEKKKKKKKEKPKPPFEDRGSATLPTGPDKTSSYVKLGHWYTMRQKLRSNNDDFSGRIVAETVRLSGARPIPLRNTQIRLESDRPVSLPKGRTRQVEVLGFLPDNPSYTSGVPNRFGTPTKIRQIGMRTQVRARGGRDVFPNQPPAIVMQPHQYFCIVLSRDESAYKYLEAGMLSMKPPADIDGNFAEDQRDYIVSLHPSKTPVEIPSRSLLWTNIAYVVWDDFDPSLLTLPQKQAMIEWLHWGGQMIISGPLSLDGLKSSFLAEQLPAKPGKVLQSTQQEFDNFISNWAYDSKKESEGAQKETVYERIELLKAGGAEFPDRCGDWVVERRVGRGRIVVTSFALASNSPFVNFYGYDQFLNACLLRRPPRVFGDTMALDMSRAEKPIQWELRPGSTPVPYRDPRLTSKLRYFARDVIDLPPLQGHEYDMRGYAGDETGVASWNDESYASTTARSSLTQSAGISVPKASFIATMLAAYLLVLVPLNWLVFRLFDRVEWAWFAVPLIAIGGTALVVRLARLDIGFARSRTELGVLEIQPNFDKGHLSRYIALYSSLATPYDLAFESDNALALPFSINKPGMQEAMQVVRLKREKGTTLSGYRVLSNDTGMIHSEEMLNLGGAIRLESDGTGQRVVNDTEFHLSGVGVLRKVGGSTQFAWVDKLESRRSSGLTFLPMKEADTVISKWRDDQQESDRTEDGDTRINLSGLIRLASDPAWLRDGDVRLIGSTSQPIKGVQIRPSAAQRTFRTFVLAHLQYGDLPVPRPDVKPPPKKQLVNPEIVPKNGESGFQSF